MKYFLNWMMISQASMKIPINFIVHTNILQAVFVRLVNHFFVNNDNSTLSNQILAEVIYLSNQTYKAKQSIFNPCINHGEVTSWLAKINFQLFCVVFVKLVFWRKPMAVIKVIMNEAFFTRFNILTTESDTRIRESTIIVFFFRVSQNEEGNQKNQVNDRSTDNNFPFLIHYSQL